MTRSLTLRRETLAALTPEELAAVAGAAPAVTDTCLEKITDKFFHSYRCTR